MCKYLLASGSGGSMACWVLSECGLRPLPGIRIYPKPRNALASNNNNVLKIRTLPGSKANSFGSSFKVSTWSRDRNWGVLNVSAPLKVAITSEDVTIKRRLMGLMGRETIVSLTQLHHLLLSWLILELLYQSIVGLRIHGDL